MRLHVMVTIWLLALVLRAQNPLLPAYQAGATESFEWTGTEATLDKDPWTTVSIPSATRLDIDYRGKSPIAYTLRVLGPAIVSRLTSKHYAINGHVSYQNLASGSFIELESWFASDHPGGEEKFYYSRTLADVGPLAKMEGTDDGRDFSAPFDASGATTPLVRLVLKLHLGGSGTIQFNGVRLAQYPENPLAEGHDTVGVTMLNNKVNYTLAGMEDVPLNFIAAMLKDSAVADSSKAYSIVAAKDVPYPAIKDLVDAFREARISNVKVTGVPPAPPLSAASANTPSGKEMYQFGWPDWFARLPHDSKMDVNPQGSDLELKYWGEVPADFELQRVEQNVLSTLDSNQYAIEGKIQYSKVSPGSYLEMQSNFEPEKPGDPQMTYVTRTPVPGGVKSSSSGESDSRFQIPFDITGAKTHLRQVVLRIHLAGGYGTHIFLDDVRFVEYSDSFFPTSIASVRNVSPIPTMPLPKIALTKDALANRSAPGSSNIDRRSFSLGIFASAGTLIVSAALYLLVRRWRRYRHECGLRRIASLDT